MTVSEPSRLDRVLVLQGGQPNFVQRESGTALKSPADKVPPEILVLCTAAGNCCGFPAHGMWHALD